MTQMFLVTGVSNEQHEKAFAVIPITDEFFIELDKLRSNVNRLAEEYPGDFAELEIRTKLPSWYPEVAVRTAGRC